MTRAWGDSHWPLLAGPVVVARHDPLVDPPEDWVDLVRDAVGGDE